MKKTIAMILALFMFLGLFLGACSMFKDAAANEETTADDEKIEESTPAETEDLADDVEEESSEEATEPSEAQPEEEAEEPAADISIELNNPAALCQFIVEAAKEGSASKLAQVMRQELADEFLKLKSFNAEPTMQEILAERAFIELKVNEAEGDSKFAVKEPVYLTFGLGQDGEAWVIQEIAKTTEYFDSPQAVINNRVDKSGLLKIDYRELRGFPLCYKDLSNAGEIMRVQRENKDIFLLKRWVENSDVNYIVKLISFNGLVAPAELVYKEDGEVYNSREMSPDYGLMLYETGAAELFDRLEEIFK